MSEGDIQAFERYDARVAAAVVRIDVSNEGRLACAAQGLVLIRDPKPR